MLLTAVLLSLAAMAVLTWRAVRADRDDPARLIGQLRVAQWAAILLASLGGLPVGLAIATTSRPFSNLDAGFGVIFVGLAGIVLQRDPREGLLIAALSFVAQALFVIAHRPGWLAADFAPHWFAVGCAIYDVTLAAMCYVARRV